MDCKTVEKNLSAWMDGELDAGTDEQVNAHISGCERCRAKAEALKQVAGHLRALPRVDAPADFAEKLRHRMDAGPVWKRFLKRLFIPLHIKIPAELAAAAALGVLLFFVLLPGGQKEPGLALEEEAGKAAPIRLAWTAAQRPPVRAFNAPKAMERGVPGDSGLEREARERALSARKPPRQDGVKADAESPGRLAEKSAGSSPGQTASSQPAALSRIRRAVEANRGKLLAIDRDAAGRPVSVHIEIPDAGYAAFIDVLSHSGEFRSPPPEMPENLADSQGRLELIIEMK